MQAEPREGRLNSVEHASQIIEERFSSLLAFTASRWRRWMCWRWLHSALVLFVPHSCKYKGQIEITYCPNIEQGFEAASSILSSE